MLNPCQVLLTPELIKIHTKSPPCHPNEFCAELLRPNGRRFGGGGYASPWYGISHWYIGMVWYGSTVGMGFQIQIPIGIYQVPPRNIPIFYWYPNILLVSQ